MNRFLCFVLIVAFVVLVPQYLSAQQSPTAAAAVAAGDDAGSAAAALPGFKAALGKAATHAYRDGEISRVDLAKIRLAILLRPRVVAEAQQLVIDEGAKAGVIKQGSDVAAIDWNAILAFIQALLPLILQLIELFSSQAAAAMGTSGVASYAPLVMPLALAA